MKQILVTGANRGLGFEFVKQYLVDGNYVIALSRKPEILQSLKDQLPDRLKILSVDLTDFETLEKCATELQGERIDILINNAGVFGEEQSFENINFESWQKVMQLNVFVPTKIVQTFLPHVLNGKDKKIINITSRMGSIDDNTSGGYYIYRSSKTALNMVTKSLAVDLGKHGVTVIAMHPGWVQTDMGGNNAPLQPEESISGIRKVIENLKNSQNGKFLEFSGMELPW